MDDETLLARLRALGDPTRLAIVRFLAGQCCGRAVVNEEGGVKSPSAGEVCCHLTGRDRITSTVSHHLADLEACGLVTKTRDGKFLRLTLDLDVYTATLDALRPDRLTETCS